MRKLLLPRGAVNAVYLPYLQSPRRYQIFFGGASSGKSCFLATRAVLDTLQGRSTLVIRQVARTLRTSCWNEIGKAAARLGLTGCFRFNKTEMTVTARNNGAQILFAGLDDVEKIKSISPAGGALTDIWIEEATEISYADFKQLDKRLRGQSRHEKRLTLSFNPVYKTHWIYREFFGGWDEGGRAYQSDTVSILKTTYQDNAFLTADDRAALENERDPYYRQVYVYDEICERGLTNDQLATRLRAFAGSAYVVCDSAEPKSIADLRRCGVSALPARKGPDSLMHGVQWLRAQEIVVAPRCRNLIRELTLYQWQRDREGNTLRQPRDRDNHLIDALRYALEGEMEARYAQAHQRPAW